MWLKRSHLYNNKHWLIQTANQELDEWLEDLKNSREHPEVENKFVDWESEFKDLISLYREMRELSKEYQDNPSSEDSDGKLKGVTDRKHSINNSITAIQNHIVQYFRQHPELVEDKDVFDVAEKSIQNVVDNLDDADFKTYLQRTIPLFLKK